MNKHLLLSLVLCCSIMLANAQYYYMPFINAGTNPGGINSDNEYPVGGGLPAGWVQIITTSPNATPIWTAVQTIPFTFSFNGSPVTQFKVSTSGILTFDVATALAAPSYTRAALPNAAIPNNSVCIWGLSSLGTNDYIVTKTFGTAPNRQLWIQFSSFGYGTTTPSDGSNFTYWSIVLEETSNHIHIVDNRTGGFAGVNVVSAGIQINSTTAYPIFGSPNLSSLAGTNPAPADNTYYTFIQGVQPAIDLSGVSLSSAAFPNIIYAPYTIKGTVENMGSATVNSMTINYSVNNGAPITANLTGLNILPGTRYDFVHATMWNPSIAGTYTVKAWADNINSSNDQNNGNDTITQTIVVSPAIPNIIDQYNAATLSPNVITTVTLTPRDLDFHPDLSRNELWVVRRGASETTGGSTTKISNAGQPGQTTLSQTDQNAMHFMDMPTGIAFSDNGNFATSPGVYDANHDGGTPFTGPALWNPISYALPSGGNGSHIDMLHQSPWSMGIAHEKDNVFWIFDGDAQNIARYDFVKDHGPGNSDHSDGIIHVYPELSVTRINDEIPSQLEVDKLNHMLYIVDNGNARILRLDINSGSPGGTPSTPLYEPVADYSEVTFATWNIYVSSGLVQPSGIALVGNRLLVSDYSNGIIHVYDKSGATGTELFQLNTGAPGIMGITIGPDGKIWYVNATSGQVVRLDYTPVSVNENEFTRGLNIYPNPATEALYINFKSALNESCLIRLADVTGKTIYSQQFKLQTGNNNFSIPIKEMSVESGIYFLSVNQNQNVTTRKVVIE